MKRVVFYKLDNDKEPVKEWLIKLDNPTVKRLKRIDNDTFINYKQIVPNLYELSFFFGEGYRAY